MKHNFNTIRRELIGMSRHNIYHLWTVKDIDFNLFPLCSRLRPEIHWTPLIVVEFFIELFTNAFAEFT